MRRRIAPSVALALAGALACRGGSGGGGGDGGPAAVTACGAATDCGGALVCVDGSCVDRAPPAPSCTPPSRPSISLGPPMTASEPVTCTTPVRSSVHPGTQLLGELRVGQEAEFQVPEGSWSVTIVSQEVAASAPDEIQLDGFPIPNSVVPAEVRAPDGRVYYDELASVPEDGDGYPDFTRLLGYYGGFTPTSGALTIPNTTPGLDLARSAGGLPAGTWRLTVNDYAYECQSMSGCTGGGGSGRYDVRVITRPGPIASTGTLDLDVYVASLELTAAQAARDPNMDRLFQRVASALGNAGLCLGRVVLHDLPEWARQRYASVNIDSTGPCDPLSQLFTLAEAQTPSIHLFLVDELTVTEGDTQFQIVGIDGSIPGPSGVPGTVNGGAVVTLGDLGQGRCGSAPDVAGCGTDRLAYIVAHEASHWLGLYHTTERSGTLFDPLADTATCACAACAPPSERARCADRNTDPSQEPTPMIGSYCADDARTCAGASNLMFWLLDDARSNGSLTPEQAEVMRLNPAVR
ncbi:conserved hypothetical protein [Anaeromyxobacter sp. Fw109-5]|nr:conserved hypothetical protein [Anaeromyxobacter sp. Fw109-5]